MADTRRTGESDASFALHCRGDVRLYRGELDCTPKSKKGRALLAILAAEQRPLTRVKIIDLLWSDRQEEQARASLRTLLADLKEQFCEHFDELLIVDRERVALGSSVRSDLTDPSIARPAGELFEGLDHIDPELDGWLRVERQKWSSQPQVSGVGQRLLNPPPPRFRVRARVTALALLAVLVIASAILMSWRPWAEPERPVIAVLKFKDMTGRNALLADGLAEELRIQLTQYPVLQVIGRESSEAPSIVRAGLAGVRHKLGATHVVEGSVINRDGQPHLNIRLATTGGGQLIWSQLMRAEGAMIRSGAAAIGSHIAGDINETVGQGSGTAFHGDAKAYEEVFAARRAIWSFDPKEAIQARISLNQVIERYPHFAPALAVMAEATIYASDHPWFRGPLPLKEARREAVLYARRAIRAAPSYGSAYTALGVAYHETPSALAPLRRAVELNPGSYEAQHRFARALELAGDYQQALVHQRAAATLEPLGIQPNYMLMRALQFEGRRDELPELARRFLSRTDDERQKLRFFVGYAEFTGDFSRQRIAALRLLRLDPNNSQFRRAIFWSNINFGDRSGALSYVSSPDSITAIILQDDLPALLRKVDGLRDDFWALDFEMYDASEYLYNHGRSDVLLRMYDEARAHSGGEQPSLASLPLPLLLALRDAGRQTEYARLLRENIRLANRIAAGGTSPFITSLKGQLSLVGGRNDEGLNLIEMAQRSDWLSLQPPGLVRLEDLAGFRDVRDDPRFKAIIARYYANMAREKREFAAESKRFGNGPINFERLISEHS